jgi:exodeoxyribonuclease VII small subunit
MSKSDSVENPLSFTNASRSLESIVERFRTETLPLEEALLLFEEGVSHVKTCQSKLSQTRGRVEELVKSLQDGGNTITRPFGDNETF